MRVLDENTRKNAQYANTTLWFPNEFRLFWLLSIKWQYLNTAKNLIIPWIHRNRERERGERMNGNSISNFHFGWNNLFKNVFEKQLNFKLVFPATKLRCDLKCMYVSVSFFHEPTKFSTYENVYTFHLACYVHCNWMESFERAYIDSFVENQINKRTKYILGTKESFFALCKIYLCSATVSCTISSTVFQCVTRFPKLKSNTVHKERLSFVSFNFCRVGGGCCCCCWLFFYLCGKYVTSKPSFQSYRTTRTTLSYTFFFGNRIDPKIVLKFYAIAQLFCTKHVTNLSHHLFSSGFFLLSANIINLFATNRNQNRFWSCRTQTMDQIEMSLNYKINKIAQKDF